MVRIGVLGSPASIAEHVAVLRNLNGFEIVGGHLLDEKADHQAGPDGMPDLFADPEQLINICDAVDISSFSPSLLGHITDAIRQSKHLFIHNPFTGYGGNIPFFRKLLSESRGIIQLAQTSRYNPAIMASIPYIGKPRYLEFRRMLAAFSSAPDESLISSYMIHDIDLALLICRSGIRKFTASGMNGSDQSPSFAEARIDFMNGATASFIVSRFHHGEAHTMNCFSGNNLVMVDLKNQKAEIRHMRRTDKDTTEIFSESLLVAPGNPKEEELLCFHTAINRKKYPQENIEDALHALSIGLELQEKLDRLNH